jgi:hypothetical protein
MSTFGDEYCADFKAIDWTVGDLKEAETETESEPENDSDKNKKKRKLGHMMGQSWKTYGFGPTHQKRGKARG